MKNLFLFLFYLTLPFLSNAQNPSFQWAKGMGGTNSDFGNSIAVDAAGNVFTTGYFYGVADFDPSAGVYTLTSVGLEDIFVSKLDAAGNFLWARTFGGSNSDCAFSIA